MAPLNGPFLLSVLAVVTGAAVRVVPEDGRVGTFRHLGHGDGHRWRRLRATETAGHYDHVRDTYEFAGPVPGRGFVEHKHDVIFANTTAFADDFLSAVAEWRCVPATPAERDSVFPWIAHMQRMAGAGRGSSTSMPQLPGEAEAVGSRVAFALQVDFTPALAAEAAPAFAHRLHRAAHLIFGDDSLRAFPQCAALMDGINPAFRVHAVRSTGGSNGGFRVVVEPAGLLEPFAAAHWHTREEDDVDRAMRARGLQWADFAHAGSGRRVEEFSLKRDGWNWNQDAANPGAAGSVAEQHQNFTVGYSNPPGATELNLRNSYMYFNLGVDVELHLCLWAYVDLWILGKVGLGPLGFGCDAEDERVYNEEMAGFHLRFRAALIVEAAARVEAHLAPGDVNSAIFAPDIPLKGNADARGKARKVMLGSLPLFIATGFRVSAALDLAGRVPEPFQLGAYGRWFKAKMGFQFNGWSGKGLEPIDELQWHDLAPGVDALPMEEAWREDFALTSARLSLLPRFMVTLYFILPFDAVLPLRLQMDADAVAKDAVACDLPLCMRAAGDGSQRGLRGLYGTLQFRVRLALGRLTVRAIIGQLQLPKLLAWLADMVIPDDWLIWDEQTLLDAAFTPRLKLFAGCLRVHAAGPARALPALPAPQPQRHFALPAPPALAVARPAVRGAAAPSALSASRDLSVRLYDVGLVLDRDSPSVTVPYEIPAHGRLVFAVHVKDATQGWQLGMVDAVDFQRDALDCWAPAQGRDYHGNLLAWKRPLLNTYTLRVTTDIANAGAGTESPRAYGTIARFAAAEEPTIFAVAPPGTVNSSDPNGNPTQFGAVWTAMQEQLASEGRDAASEAVYFVDLACANYWDSWRGQQQRAASDPACTQCNGKIVVRFPPGTQASASASPRSSRTGSGTPSWTPSVSPNTLSRTPSPSATPSTSSTPTASQTRQSTTATATPPPPCDYTIRNGAGDDDLPADALRTPTPTPSTTPQPSPHVVVLQRSLTTRFTFRLRVRGLPAERLRTFAYTRGPGLGSIAEGGATHVFSELQDAFLRALSGGAVLPVESISQYDYTVSSSGAYIDFFYGVVFRVEFRSGPVTVTFDPWSGGVPWKPVDQLTPAEVFNSAPDSEGIAFADAVEAVYRAPSAALVNLAASIGLPSATASIGSTPLLTCTAATDPRVIMALGGAAACAPVPHTNTSALPLRFLPAARGIYESLLNGRSDFATRRGSGEVLDWSRLEVAMLPIVEPIPSAAFAEPLEYIQPRLYLSNWTIMPAGPLKVTRPVAATGATQQEAVSSPTDNVGAVAGLVVGGVVLGLGVAVAALQTLRRGKGIAGPLTSAGPTMPEPAAKV